MGKPVSYLEEVSVVLLMNSGLDYVEKYVFWKIELHALASR